MHGDTSRSCSHRIGSCSRAVGRDFASSSWVMLMFWTKLDSSIYLYIHMHISYKYVEWLSTSHFYAIAEISLVLVCFVYRISAEAEFGNSLDSGSSEQPLGILPHQIRGALSQFSQMILVGHSSNSCTACCPTVSNLVTNWEDNLNWANVLLILNWKSYSFDFKSKLSLIMPTHKKWSFWSYLICRWL